MITKWIKNKMRKMMSELLDEEHDRLVLEVEGNITIPDAEDVAQNIDIDDIVYNLDYENITDNICTWDIVNEIDISEVASELDVEDIANYLDIDSNDIEVDYDELAAYVVEELDLDDIAHRADVDKTIFTHIHMLQTKVDALIAVVSESAQNTLDLMLFNKGLEGEEQ